MESRAIRTAALIAGVCLTFTQPARPDAYVTPASTPRWSTAAGIRFNDVGGIRFNDVGGIRFNDVGGIRFNDVGGLLFTDTSGIRFNDVGGIRFNDAGGIGFESNGTGPSIDLELLGLMATLPDTSAVGVVVTYKAAPTPLDLQDLRAAGIGGGTMMRSLPMIVVNATKDQIVAISRLPSVRSVWSNRMLSWVTHESLSYIGVGQAEADPFMRTPAGLPFSGRGVTIAFVDTGIDGTHPDLAFGSKVLQNARMEPALGDPLLFLPPLYTEGLPDTDLVLGHGTFGAGIAAGTGAASGGYYRGVAPGAGLVGVSVGDVYIINVLEGFDYVLSNAARYGIRIVNCSFATTGPFDPDDPVNIATRALYDRGISVVFAAGNYGPAPDTLSPYAVAPWVIGVASGDKTGRLSSFSSRGIFNEGLYHPTLTAPGEAIVSTSASGLQQVTGVAGVADPSQGATVPPALSPYYSVASGTSFAAPHVAGTIALMLEADPGLTPGAIKTILQRAATPVMSRDRSEVGAGYLDAWAALALTLDPTRGFGSFIPEMLDQRAWRYLFSEPAAVSGTVPAGGHAVVGLDAGAGSVAAHLGIAWGIFPALADLDLALYDGGGAELSRSGSFNAAGLFGSTEGVTWYRPADMRASAVVSFKIPSLVDQDFTGEYQTVRAVFDVYPDVAPMSAPDRHAVTVALTALAMKGRSNCFCGDGKLSRGETARLVAMAAQLPQTLPGSPTYLDVAPTDPAFPYVESVAGPQARRGQTMAPRKPALFGASNDVTRLELAVAAIRALGLSGAAEARAGETLGLADEWLLPPDTRGYVALSLELGILTTKSAPAGPVFQPDGTVTRLEAARAAAAMIARVAGDSPPGAAGGFASGGASGSASRQVATLE